MTDHDIRFKTGRRILVFAEAVTLAHLARPIAFLENRARRDLEIHLACPDNGFRKFLGSGSFPLHTLNSMSPARFLRALEWGLPIYTGSLLKRYIEEDLALMQRVEPDIVIGDFRLSLSISARMAGVEYWNIANAYWRPEYCSIPPRPVLRSMALLPSRLADTLYRASIGGVFAAHARPFNRVRRAHGLPELPPDVRYFYTDGDVVLYADRSELYPTLPLPPGHRFLGPLLWAPPVSPPDWWNDLPGDRPVIYLALGSSGHRSAFRSLLEILSELPVTVIAATGGSETRVEGNLHLAPWLDGNAACRRADLMISNGGVMSCHQALEAGIPVLGVCSNMDQFLSMRVMEENGLGYTLRADSVNPGAVTRLLEKVLPAQESPDSPDLRQITAGSTADGKK